MGDVIDIFSKRDKPAKKENKEKSVHEMFQEIIERNMKLKERIQKEKQESNKSVLRSHRIKD